MAKLSKSENDRRVEAVIKISKDVFDNIAEHLKGMGEAQVLIDLCRNWIGTDFDEHMVEKGFDPEDIDDPR